MRSVSRRSKAPEPRELIGQDLASARPTATSAAVAAGGLELAQDLLGRSEVSVESARDALDRLRRRAGAVQALFWTIVGTRATCLVYSGDGSTKGVRATVEIAGGTIAVDHLRRQGTVIRRAGDTSAINELVPTSVQSLAALIAPGDRTTGVLILGWDTPRPPCDQSTATPLQIAAAVLLRTVGEPRVPRGAIADTILGSLAEPIIVVDRDGEILSVNAAWTAWTLPQGFEALRPGANFFKIARRAAGPRSGYLESADVVAGIEAVARGALPAFQATFAGPAPGTSDKFLLTATPLRARAGGAVIAHANINAHTAMALAGNVNHAFDVLDAVPMPIWIHADDDTVVYGNERWRKIADGLQGGAKWTDVVHPHDRARVSAGVPSKGQRGRAGTFEARIKTADGVYRWSICTVVPFDGVDAALRGYLGYCCDIGVQRHSEWALSEVTSKLAAAREEERSRIGRELHDDVGQQAALLAARIETLRDRRKTTEHSLRAGIEEASRRVHDLAISIHDLSHELHPPKLKLIGLVKTLASLCRDTSRQSGVNVSFHANGVAAHLPDRVALCMFRVAQEALQNALKHSGANAIEVTLAEEAASLTLAVADTGQGFDPLAAPNSGIGLLSMRERVELNGGTLLIDTSAAGGTKITALLPLSMHAAGDGMP
jgi:signal transduction histidine kinase